MDAEKAQKAADDIADPSKAEAKQAKASSQSDLSRFSPPFDRIFLGKPEHLIQ